MKAYTSALHLGKMTTIEKGLRHASKHNKTFHPSSYAWFILYAFANHDQHVVLFYSPLCALIEGLCRYDYIKWEKIGYEDVNV